jgi:hypothetical protein
MTDINDRSTHLWEYDGAAWTSKSAAGPVQSASGAYDSARKVTVMFEDITGVTWLWNGVSWARQSPAASPPKRRFSAAAFDSDRGVTVLFGGMPPSTNGTDMMNDTWEWDGANWTEKEPAHKPPIRFWHAMAYDSARKVTVVFAGGTSYDTMFRFTLDWISDTWEWDGTDWKEVQFDESPAARCHHAMAYDSGREKIILFGGHDEMADTWEYGVFQ